MRVTQAMLFGVMLIISMGNSGLQSVLPSLGRVLKVPDALVGLTFSLSAFAFAWAAPWWAARRATGGGKMMIILGLIGFSLSLSGSGMALIAGLSHYVSGWLSFAGFVAGRLIYGFFGAAAPPASQAIVAEGTNRKDRTRALTLLASAFGLGTILGPALTPFLISSRLGLAAPPFAFAFLGLIMAFLVAFGLTTPGQVASETRVEPTRSVQLKDPRVRPWLVLGIISSHAQAVVTQTMAFLILDRLHVEPAAAQSRIGLILMVGAAGSLLVQWALIPRFNPTPHTMIRLGCVIAALGCAGVPCSGTMTMLALAFCIASVGFGLLRPGFMAGASIVVEDNEQSSVSGHVTAINAAAFVVGPAGGILLYEVWRPLPYLAAALALVGGLAAFNRFFSARTDALACCRTK